MQGFITKYFFGFNEVFLYFCFCIFFSDIRLDWRVFNEEQKNPKLLDLVVNFGKAFPLKDSKGEEIVPPPPGKNPFTALPNIHFIGSTCTFGSILSEEITANFLCV